MLAEPRVIFGQGDQTIRFVPVDRNGRPTRVTSATYSIVDIDRAQDDARRVIATGAAVLAAVSTTTSAACGHGQPSPQSITLTSAALVSAGRTYLLSSDAGGRSLVTIAAITGTNAQTLHRISGAYATGSAFQSIELEATFPAAAAADEEALQDGRRYQIVWTYAIEGEPWITAQLVHFVRYSGEAWITEAECVLGYPTMPDRMRNRGRISDAIAMATDDVIGELEGSNIVAEQYRTSSNGRRAVRFRALEYCLRWLEGADDLALADKYETRFDRLIRTIITAHPGDAVKLNQTDDAAEGSAEVAGYFRRS